MSWERQSPMSISHSIYLLHVSHFCDFIFSTFVVQQNPKKATTNVTLPTVAAVS